jgi:transposase
MPSKFDENTKVKAVRLVREHRDDYDTEWAAMRVYLGATGNECGDPA